MECPECGSTNIVYSQANGAWVCRDCGAVFIGALKKPEHVRKRKVSGRVRSLGTKTRSRKSKRVTRNARKKSSRDKSKRK